VNIFQKGRGKMLNSGNNLRGRKRNGKRMQGPSSNQKGKSVGHLFDVSEPLLVPPNNTASPVGLRVGGKFKLFENQSLRMGVH